MFARTLLSLGALAASSLLPRASEEKALPEANERDASSSVTWSDLDGDGDLDVAAVGAEGRLAILRNVGTGGFDDVTAEVGLAEMGNVALVSLADYDADGRLDLFVGAREGRSRLFRNELGVFVDVTDGSGLDLAGAVQSARWLDHDRDGRLDLFVITSERNAVFRGLAGGIFEAVDLPRLAKAATDSVLDGIPVLGANRISPVEAESLSSATKGRDAVRMRTAGAEPTRAGSVRSSDNEVAPDPATSETVPAPVDPLGCARSIRDQANPGSCLQATSVPTAGLLFPGPHLGGVNNVQSGLYSFVGGGENNQATQTHTVIGGGYRNVASGGSATVGGGFGNTALSYGTVGGGFYNDASGTSSTVGGGGGNFAAGDLATIGGGGGNYAGVRGSTVSGGELNAAWAYNATVGGGFKNIATGNDSTIGGGCNNTVQGTAATVGGGTFNFAVGGSTVGGGSLNYATGGAATIGGGILNRAVGSFSTVIGGFFNGTVGDYSFAAGRRAVAIHDGSFVWGDSQDTVVKTSSADNEFNVYASGGVRILTNSAATTGVLLAPGGGSWSSVSDREAKENLELVDARQVLDRVCALPISTWNYKAQDDSVRHMGPMAQDFHAAFGLGVSDELIDTIDPDGVALAAIQGLRLLVAEKEVEIEALKARNEELEDRVTRLESIGAEVASLKAHVQALLETR
jgi:hypothetical protein